MFDSAGDDDEPRLRLDPFVALVGGAFSAELHA